LGPDPHCVDEYKTFVVNLLTSDHYDVLIPTSDITAEFLSVNKAVLKNLTSVLMPDYKVFMAAYDKNMLMEHCQRAGYPHPYTINLSRINADSSEIKNFPYPALIKPNLTSGARGMKVVNNYEEFIESYPEIRQTFGQCHLQQFIKSGGKQVKIQLFTDANSETIYASAILKQRFFPVNGGSSCCNITIDLPEYYKTCAQVLKDIGWVGFADFDLIENPDSGEFLIMEINPRTPACIRSVYKSGLDFATMIADGSLGRDIRCYSYTPGKRLRHLGFDILWFLKSPMRFKSKPSWFEFFGKDIYYQDIIKGNMSSFIYGTAGNIKKILNSDFRKAKSGI
ncbi:MAG: ATP-grasp domain-containing protein, partial [Muribaculaceae bacterium]|nr:ATP-grasp domain-containing protein [Muribaculaceae bacterium]